MQQKSEWITLGGGCFWCIEAAFSHVRGVLSAVSGYAGGQTENPNYQAVCSGDTGHAEVVQIEYNPAEISLPALLDIFFAIHDPTTPNRQGNDIGTQYRSVVFYHTQNQIETVAEAIAQAAENAGGEARIVTEVLPVPDFYPAEEYHQRYFEKNPGQGYCQVIIAPKLAKLRRHFASSLVSSAPQNSFHTH